MHMHMSHIFASACTHKQVHTCTCLIYVRVHTRTSKYTYKRNTWSWSMHWYTHVLAKHALINTFTYTAPRAHTRTHCTHIRAARKHIHIHADTQYKLISMYESMCTCRIYHIRMYIFTYECAFILSIHLLPYIRMYQILWIHTYHTYTHIHNRYVHTMYWLFYISIGTCTHYVLIILYINRYIHMLCVRSHTDCVYTCTQCIHKWPDNSSKIRA